MPAAQLAHDTLRRAGRALVTYARYQALTPTKNEGRPVITRYGARPWLQQLGLHGRTNPSPADASGPDGSARASRRRAQHLRAAETFVIEDLWWLAEIDRGYAWVRQGDGGNGYGVIRVGQGIDAPEDVSTAQPTPLAKPANRRGGSGARNCADEDSSPSSAACS